MLLGKVIKNKFIYILCTSIIISWIFLHNKGKSLTFENIRTNYFSKQLIVNKHLTQRIKVKDNFFKIEYTFDDKLENYIQKKLKLYHPDYASIVIMNSQGKILSLVGYQRHRGFNRFLPFTNFHPAASLFKIITASALLKKGVEKNKLMKYKGKGTTLYKYQLKKITSTRWIRKVTFSDAFAHSNNVVLSRLALKNLSIENISKMASKFMFNKFLFPKYKLSKSNYIAPSSQYSLAEISSGFNRTTLISPIHASVMSNIVLNNGFFVSPYFVNRFITLNTKATKAYKHSFIYDKKQQIFSKRIALNLEDMMAKTLYKGTARRYFRGIYRKYKKKYMMGGKTGSIRGGIPYGKNDWFTFFIKRKEDSKSPRRHPKKYDGISIATLMINKNKWYVKSTDFTKSIIHYMLKNNMI